MVYPKKTRFRIARFFVIIFVIYFISKHGYFIDLFRGKDFHVTVRENLNVSNFLSEQTFRNISESENISKRRKPEEDVVRDLPSNTGENWQLTLDDVHISVKTTRNNHGTRMKVLLDSWIPTAFNQTYIFTDTDDKELSKAFPEGHVINTRCRTSHNRIDLCCKFSKEFDFYTKTDKKWFCHVDDDNYLNVDNLVKLLQGYDHQGTWYLGRPSRPTSVDFKNGTKLSLWFATTGAGVCLSRALAEKIKPIAGDGKFTRICRRILQPDDCTLGYIIGILLKTDLTVIQTFHSHLEDLGAIKDLQNQITIGEGWVRNVIDLKGFNKYKDPTRFLSLHCMLHPKAEKCKF